MNILKATTKFIGWLSGSLAGIGALLTLLGYLVTAAHGRLLGLDITLLGFNPEYYFRQGGNFLFYIVDALSQRILLPILVIFLIPPSLFLAVDLFPEGGRFHGGVAAWKAKFHHLFSRYGNNLKIISFLLLVAMLFLQLGPDLDGFIRPLKISDLIHEAERPGPNSLLLDDPIARALIHNQRDVLKKHFFFLLMSLFRAGLYLYIVWHVTLNRRFRTLLVAPFVIIFWLYAVFLPMNYGVLLVKSEFPPISVESKQSSAAAGKGRFFLLNKTDKAFILWNVDARKIIWVPVGEIGAAEIDRGQPLWSKPKQTEKP